MSLPVGPFWRCRAGDDDPEEECMRERQGYYLYCPLHMDLREARGEDRAGPLVTVRVAAELRDIVADEMANGMWLGTPWG